MQPARQNALFFISRITIVYSHFRRGQKVTRCMLTAGEKPRDKEQKDQEQDRLKPLPCFFCLLYLFVFYYDSPPARLRLYSNFTAGFNAHFYKYGNCALASLQITSRSRAKIRIH